MDNMEIKLFGHPGNHPGNDLTCAVYNTIRSVKDPPKHFQCQSAFIHVTIINISKTLAMHLNMSCIHKKTILNHGFKLHIRVDKQLIQMKKISYKKCIFMIFCLPYLDYNDDDVVQHQVNLPPHLELCKGVTPS